MEVKERPRQMRVAEGWMWQGTLYVYMRDSVITIYIYKTLYNKLKNKSKYI